MQDSNVKKNANNHNNKNSKPGKTSSQVYLPKYSWIPKSKYEQKRFKNSFLVDSNFRGTLENFWTQGVHQSESIQTGCVSMLAHCGLWAASNCVVFVSQTLIFVLASCTMEAFVLSLLSLHCLCSRPLCPNSNGEKVTHFRMLWRVSRIAGLGVKHWLNLYPLVILRA